jgi:hypothetical protein
MGVRVTPQVDTISSFVIAAAGGVQTYPAVVFNGTDYIAVWSDCQLGRYYINTTRITPSGTIPGSSYWVGICGSQDEDSPDIAYNGTRNLCVWSEEDHGVRGRFINNDGQPEDTVLTIAAFTITSYTAPAIASDGQDYLVVWFERRSGGTDWDVLGQIVSDQGTVVGDQITIATGPNSQYDADVLFDGVNYFVVWRETNNSIYGRRLDTGGNLVGTPVPVSEPTAVYRYQPTLVNSPDNYLIAWSEWRNGYFDVYGNIDIIPTGIGESIDVHIYSDAVIVPSLCRDQCLLSYCLSHADRIQVSMCDAGGRLIRQFVDGSQEQGKHELRISTRCLAAGVYFLRIKTDGGGLCRKFTVIK